MKKFLLHILTFAIVLGLYSNLLASNAPATAKKEVGPSAFVVEGTHKFDPVPEGSKIEHEFVIQNKGDAPLVIESVKPG